MFALPSVDEAFGVAYIEAMARGVPAIGCAGEAGPEEIAASRRRDPCSSRPRDPEALAAAIARAIERRVAALGDGARANVEANFTWEACGRATVAAYEEALRG